MLEAPKPLEETQEDVAVHIEKDGEHTLYILFVENAIVSVVLTQTRNAVTYIQFVDSTGIKRGYTAKFIIGVISLIPGLVTCFSHPRSEPIFGRSSKCASKKIRAPFDLFKYWISIFQSRCKNGRYLTEMKRERRCGVGTWSNFRADRSHPYESIKEIEFFEDDPIAKMIKSMQCEDSMSIDELFLALLVRSDFACGGFLFSQCVCSRNTIDNESLQIIQYLKGNILIGTECSVSGISVPIIEDIRSPVTGRISQIIKMLRDSDFSGISTGAKETSKILMKFRIKLKYFKVPKPLKSILKEDDIVVRLVPRKSKMS
ncbi:hypothetical protein PAEPH01_1752 [Pancytospora epiphaga]|nr:hypothetical protein PAEPH01_1752 [Pancytospora epiphaga]